MKLGAILKQVRNQQGLSQKELSEGVCSQSMLSAIENNQYTPNAELLIKLCQRLGISLSEFSLADNFAVTANANFNQTVDELCNSHRYFELKNFLLDNSTINQIKTSSQTQAYYYYLGVAQLHTDDNLDEARQNLTLSINSAEKKKLSTLSRLGIISLAYVHTKYNQTDSASGLIEQAMADLPDAIYEPNLNVVVYLAALISYEMKENVSLTIQKIDNAIDYISNHDSHYMLANCYRLVAQIAQEQGNAERELEATKRQEFLSELFHEKINDDF